jgi:hypothetical protein
MPELSPFTLLFGFLVSCMLAAAATKFAELQTLRRGFLVLCRDVIATLAFGALQHNVIAWHCLYLSTLSANG